MPINFTDSWNGERLENIRRFLQQTLGSAVTNLNAQTNGGYVTVTFKKADGTDGSFRFTAAEGSENEGYQAFFTMTRRQTVYSAGSNVQFTYNFEQMLYGEYDYTIQPSITFDVYTVDTSTNGTKDKIYSTTTNAIGSHSVDIPASVFNGISGAVRIIGTYNVMYEGQSYTGSKTIQLSIAECRISFPSAFKLATQVKGYNSTTGSLQDAYIYYEGTYNAELQVYIDGVLRATVPATSGNNSLITYNMNTVEGASEVLADGRHTVQVIAKMDSGTQDADGQQLYIYSNTLLFDFYKGLNGYHIGIMADFNSSEVINDTENGITIDTQQYVNSKITYAASQYSINDGYTEKINVTVYKDSDVATMLAVGPNDTNDYVFRDTAISSYQLSFNTQNTNRRINIRVQANSSGVSTAVGALIDINAQNRSNEENASKIDKFPFTDSAGQQYEGTLEGFQFASSEGAVIDGWDGTSLLFKGNNRLTIPYAPFRNFSINTGMYLEFTFKVDQVLDSDVNIIECMGAGGRGGFYLKAEEAGIITNNNSTVFTPFKAGETYTVGFMVRTYTGGSWTNTNGGQEDHTSERTTVLELFVNGIRTGAAVFVSGDSFDTNATIAMNGLGAIWRWYSMRVYNRSLTPREAFNNWLTTFTDGDAIVAKALENDILTSNNSDVSSSKLIGLGKNVMIIEVGNGVSDVAYLDSDGVGKLSPTGTPSETRVISTREAFLDPQAKKKQNYLVKGITYYNNGTLNDDYSFKVGPTLMQCQGTSSTYYSRKNYDIFFTGQKYAKDDTSPSQYNWVSEFDESIGAASHSYDGSSKTKPRYKMGANDKPVPVVCMKADYVDSSNLHNTCITRLINDTWRNMGSNYMTPPQYNNDTNYDDVRVGINGHPVDVFVKDGDGETYIGQYNMDNEKKDSHDVFGFTAGSGNPSVGEAVCIEFLENNRPATLFKTDGTFNWTTCSSSQTESGEAVPELEFRYPSNDWVDGSEEDKSSVKTLFNWVYECWDKWKKSYNEETQEYSNTDFIDQVHEHFNVYNLCAWYLYTEYFLAVDQRSKNMMLATWDRQHWYFLPYDSDTAMGVTNDGYLIVPYDADEETLNPRAEGQYAYMGHDSALWELVRHFLFDDTYTGTRPEIRGCNLCSVAATLRQENASNRLFNTANVKRYFNEGRDYWSEMSYNFDEDTKYIAPLTKQSAQGTMANFAQFVQGARDAHRDWLIDKRFRLLDAKYSCGFYETDRIQPYLSIANTDTFEITIVTHADVNIKFFKNTTAVYANVRCKAGEPTKITMRNVDVGTNDPFIITGVSYIESIDFGESSKFLYQNLNFGAQGIDCGRLRTLVIDAAGKDGRYSGTLQSIISPLVGVKELTVKGLPNVNGILDLSNNLLLERVDIDCEGLTSIRMPYNIVNMKSFNVGKLNAEVPWEFWDEFNTIHNRKTGGSIAVFEFTTDNPNYGLRTGPGSANTIKATGRYTVFYLTTPSVVFGDGSNAGLFGLPASMGDSTTLKKVIYAKVDSNAGAANEIVRSSMAMLFTNCNALESVNTRGWYVGATKSGTGSVSFLIPGNIKSIDLSFVKASELPNGITGTESTLEQNVFNGGYNTANNTVEYVKFDPDWFEAVKTNVVRPLVPWSSALNADFFKDLAETLPNIESSYGETKRTIHFGSNNYNDYDKFPNSVRRVMEDKGWILAI